MELFDLLVLIVRQIKKQRTKNSQKSEEKIILTLDDDASVTWPTEPMQREQRRQWYCWDVMAVVGIGRRTWCCRGRRAAVSGFKTEVTIIILLGGGM